MRQGLPLSLILFSIYMADLEKHLSRGQTGGIVIGKKKMWSLSCADDIVVVSKIKQDMDSLMKRLAKYLEKKDMILNVGKTKIINFNRGR